MGMIKSFATSEQAEVNGIWVYFPDPDDPEGQKQLARVKLGRYGGRNARLVAARERIMAPYRHVPQDKLDPKLATRLGMQVFVEGCIIEWQSAADRPDLTYEDGLPVVPDGWVRGIEQPGDRVVLFSTEACVALFDAAPDVFSFLVGKASDAALYKDGAKEADSKN